IFRKPVRKLLHLWRDRDNWNVSEPWLDIRWFERIRLNLHSALVDLAVECVQQILPIAPVTLYPPRRPLLTSSFVLDYDSDVGNTRRLDLTDDLMDPFSLNEGID